MNGSFIRRRSSWVTHSGQSQYLSPSSEEYSCRELCCRGIARKCRPPIHALLKAHRVLNLLDGRATAATGSFFFDRECGGRRRHKHRHRLIIAVDGKKSVEARRDPGSALESSPASLKSVRISPNDELRTKPEAQADAHGNRPEHKRASHPRTARDGEPPRIPPAVYGYYVYAATPVRGRSR